MNEVSASLFKWFPERPNWLQITATRFIAQAEFPNRDVSELETVFKQEAEGEEFRREVK